MAGLFKWNTWFYIPWLGRHRREWHRRGWRWSIRLQKSVCSSTYPSLCPSRCCCCCCCRRRDLCSPTIPWRPWRSSPPSRPCRPGPAWPPWGAAWSSSCWESPRAPRSTCFFLQQHKTVLLLSAAENTEIDQYLFGLIDPTRSHDFPVASQPPRQLSPKPGFPCLHGV